MLSQDFVQSIIDECIFVKTVLVRGEHYLLIIGIFVDDIFVLGDSTVAVLFLEALERAFRCRDMGDLKFFLGIHVERNRAEKNNYYSPATVCSTNVATISYAIMQWGLLTSIRCGADPSNK